MARITDENKIILVKKALIDIIVRDGSTNASIAKMAKEAGVSSGYLYRHYDSKESLLEHLYIEKLSRINEILLTQIDENKQLIDCLTSFYGEIIKLSKSNENEILFLIKMMTDYSVKLSETDKIQLTKTINKFKEKYTNELNPNINSEHIFTQVLGTILIFFNMRKRAVFTSSSITKDEIKSFSQMVLNALK